MAGGKGGTVVTGTAAAAAEALRQVEPDVVAASTAAPQASITDLFGRYAAEGLVRAELVVGRDDEAALDACIEAARAGRRAVCVASSHSLAAMCRPICAASALRLPVVMFVLGGPPAGDALCRDPDGLGARDAGWIQVHAETPQEAYDSTIQAVRLAEHPEVRGPVMVVADLSTMPARLGDDAQVREFAHAPYLPIRPRAAPRPPYCPDRERGEALILAIPLVRALGAEYGRLFGRHYAILDTFGMADAELAVVALGAAAGAAREALRRLRAESLRVGLVRPRLFRPFPAGELAEVLRGVHAVAVLGRSVSLGAADGPGAGPLYLETAAALAAGGAQRPQPLGFVYSAEAELEPGYVEQAVAELEEAAATGRVEMAVRYVGPCS